MLACTETITLARCDGTEWTVEIVKGVSWFSKSVGTVTDKGMQGARQIQCRIPAAVVPAMFPKIGDYLVHGSLASISSIKDLSGMDFGKITNVSDNRRGLLQHISVVAA